MTSLVWTNSLKCPSEPRKHLLCLGLRPRPNKRFLGSRALVHTRVVTILYIVTSVDISDNKHSPFNNYCVHELKAVEYLDAQKPSEKSSFKEHTKHQENFKDGDIQPLCAVSFYAHYCIQLTITGKEFVFPQLSGLDVL